MNTYSTKRENANIKNNASGFVCMQGQKRIKSELLSDTIPEKMANLHKECSFHIHDLEFYELTYNCIGLSIGDIVKDDSLSFKQMLRRLYRRIVDLTNRQSGGIGFIEFDRDASQFITTETDDELVDELREFFGDINMPTRKGCEAPYVTLNIGLCKEENGRRVTRAVLDAFLLGNEYGKPFIFPNIVFKLKKGVNFDLNDPNHDLLEKAYGVTAKRMIPTYYNTDASFNSPFDSNKLGIMGCRTRVASNVNGKDGALNRGNIASVTINLPQIAYKSGNDLSRFYCILDDILESAKNLLIHRYETIVRDVDLTWLYEKQYYAGSEQYALTQDNAEMMKHGTLAIGFIGLWDAIGIMFGHINRVEDIETHYSDGYSIIKHMRNYTDKTTRETGLNFSVLATAAEGTTGRLANYDDQNIGKGHQECRKGYYTNSFHVPVELNVPYWKKTEIEGPFHSLCNGGSITYMEFNEMPYRNVLAVEMAVENAYKNDCGYIGINFPLDVCDECGYTGRITDDCAICKSQRIKRYRRVSGYLAEETFFADGKKAEMKRRRGHFNDLDS